MMRDFLCLNFTLKTMKLFVLLQNTPCRELKGHTTLSLGQEPVWKTSGNY